MAGVAEAVALDVAVAVVIEESGPLYIDDEMPEVEAPIPQATVLDVPAGFTEERLVL